MRVIAGRWKGRRLKAPTWEGLRPTSDKLRETLFNILAPRVEGARVVDGFAGTGAVGIEALSRGAAHVTFVENDRRAAALTAANVSACGAAADYTIETGDVATVLRQQATAFDVIWLDPPYGHESYDALEAAAGALAPGGLVVLERATRREPAVPASLTRIRDVKSGDSTLTFFTRADS
ncbi:MAG TPA: 16S rRNA (guanine(966)-N(2))-methyltransferase RsmD [Vicinamibacterales bacterium]|jgi:16S rRNA (guanine(966)-N(2))-methyltransferase RsmD|nr:16S rRNA (guanine(966)-N(2))-methyltransferase RsmD [Vicinamibacterales bacterium]